MQNQKEQEMTDSVSIDEATWIERNSGKIVTGSLAIIGLVGFLWKLSKNQTPTKQELEKMKNDILNGLSYPQ